MNEADFTCGAAPHLPPSCRYETADHPYDNQFANKDIPNVLMTFPNAKSDRLI